jgi:ubiquinone/menaquinone biosynthesis C-methylase UbiE
MSSDNLKKRSIDYDEVSKVYDNVRVGDPEMVRHLLQGATLQKESLVLDVGCGTGNNTVLFAKASNTNVIGLDLSFGMLKKANEKTKQIPLVQAPADSIPFADDTLRFVFMTEVIHHLPDPFGAVCEIHRTLMHGGSLCIVTQSHAQIEGRMTSRFFPASADIDKKRYPDIDVIDKFLLDAGFSSLDSIAYRFKKTKLGADYLDTVENRGYSMLHKISQEDYERGVEALKAAFASGEDLTYSAGYTFVWATKR